MFSVTKIFRDVLGGDTGESGTGEGERDKETRSGRPDDSKGKNRP